MRSNCDRCKQLQEELKNNLGVYPITATNMKTGEQRFTLNVARCHGTGGDKPLPAVMVKYCPLCGVDCDAQAALGMEG